MRQAGILAAAGLHALHHHVERLHEDHFNAKRLATGLANLAGVELAVEKVETNIVRARLLPGWGTASKLSAEARSQGVLFNALDERSFRLVTHLDVSTPDIDRAVQVIKACLTELRSA